MTELLGQVLAAERQCCRFLRFRLDFEPDLGPIALEITGPPGTREFLQGTPKSPAQPAVILAHDLRLQSKRSKIVA